MGEGQSHAPAAYTPGKIQYPIYMRLSVPQGRSGQAENLFGTGIWYRTVQPVVSRYTDWATQPAQLLYIRNIFLTCSIPRYQPVFDQ